MLKKISLISVALLSTLFTSAGRAFAENWLTTDRISSTLSGAQRDVRIQIDKDSIRHGKENWITFMQRLQDESNQAFKPFKGEVNCIDKIFSSTLSKDKREDQFRRNGKWFVDFAHKDDPSDIISVEIDPKSDYYREKTFAWICSNYKKQIKTNSIQSF
tara:strand:+ start:2839 stop:3315 length:477 start_codon:yes stop_codon:yes gene_type:complete